MEIEDLSDKGDLNLAELLHVNIFAVGRNFATVSKMAVHACHVQQFQFPGSQSTRLFLTGHDTVHAIPRSACFSFVVIFEEVLSIRAWIYTDIFFLIGDPEHFVPSMKMGGGPGSEPSIKITVFNMLIKIKFAAHHSWRVLSFARKPLAESEIRSTSSACAIIAIRTFSRTTSSRSGSITRSAINRFQSTGDAGSPVNSPINALNSAELASPCLT